MRDAGFEPVGAALRPRKLSGGGSPETPPEVDSERLLLDLIRCWPSLSATIQLAVSELIAACAEGRK